MRNERLIINGIDFDAILDAEIISLHKHIDFLRQVYDIAEYFKCKLIVETNYPMIDWFKKTMDQFVGLPKIDAQQMPAVDTDQYIKRLHEWLDGNMTDFTKL